MLTSEPVSMRKRSLDPLWILCYSHATSHLYPLNISTVKWQEDWRKAFLATVKHSTLLWMTSTQGPSFLGSLPSGDTGKCNS